MRFFKLFVVSMLLFSTLYGAREQVNISFDELEIKEFITLISKITGKNILINQRINGTVNLVTSAPIYQDEVMGILISVLEAKGFTLVENGSFMEVVRATEAAKHNVKVLSSGRKARGSLMVTQAVKVEGENVDIVAAKIRYLISKTAKLMTMKESNTLLITDFPANIETIKSVVGRLNSRNKMRIEVVRIKYAEIKKLHAQINEIAKSLFNIKVSEEAVKVILNADINALVLIGKNKNIARIKTVIDELDQEQNLNQVVKIFSLKNSDSKSVLASINAIVAKRVYADPSLKPNVSASEEINAIIIVGNPTVIQGVAQIIEELDKEKYQVYVQARIVEINDNDASKIGLKYGFEGGFATSEGLYTFAGNLGGSSIALSDTLLNAVQGSLGSVEQILALGAALDFLKQNGASKTVSNPSLLCVNNKESSIYVGKTISIQTGSAVSTGAVQSNSFKREDIGLTLKIKPRVSSKEKVTLNVETTLENIIPVAGTAVNGQPSTTKQTVKTEAILRNGESIIIGGLVKNYRRENVSKVPILGDIPLLGWLFTHKEKEDTQDNLLVLLTPYVIEKSARLSELQKQLGEIARLQKKFDKDLFDKIEKEQKAKDVNGTKGK